MSAKGLAEVSFQRQVDYVNVAQRRIAGETFCLEMRDTLPLESGVGVYQLPANVAYLLAIYNGEEPLVSYTVDDIMPSLAGSGGENFVGPQGYALVGLTLYIVPTPVAADELDILFYAYTGDFASDEDIELTHACAIALDHLIEAYLLLDSGETEVGVNCMTLAETDMARLRRAQRGRGGHPGRMRLPGRIPGAGAGGTGVSVGQDQVDETYGSGEYGSGEYGF